MSLWSDEKDECRVENSRQDMGRSRLCQAPKSLERWRLVLDLIIENKGSDRFVESKRRKLFRAPSEEAGIIEEVPNAKVTEADAINAAETADLTTMGKKRMREFGGAFC